MMGKRPPLVVIDDIMEAGAAWPSLDALQKFVLSGPQGETRSTPFHAEDLCEAIPGFRLNREPMSRDKFTRLYMCNPVASGTLVPKNAGFDPMSVLKATK